VSGAPQQTYILHTVVIAVTVVILMVVFLIKQWG
jgi:hypothetical protein